MDQIDVVVVGAGPVGLLAAVELALAGVRVVVLERLAAPSLVAKALGIGPLGIEALQRRGMRGALDAAEAHMLACMAKSNSRHAGSDGPRYIGHFGGLALIRADAQREPARRMRPVHQQAAEAMLAERARELGVTLRRECEVTAFVQDADGIDVTWTSPHGVEQMRCAYLVACDGGRSQVRKLAGVAFPGTPPTMTMYQASVELDHPERLPGLGFQRTPGGVFAYGFLPGRLALLDFSGPPADRAAPVTHEELDAVLRRVTEADVHIKSFENASRWADNTRLADRYRCGRVLLAGDAAHVHSPFGGQGMSLGLADAANLGWKLAAVLRGDRPETLLDTYTTERRPAAQAVLANTLAQAAIMRPDPQSGAMRELLAKLLPFDDVNRVFGEMITGLAGSYDVGATHPDAGRLSGDRPLVHDGVEVTLYALMQDGGGVFLDATSGGRASSIVASAARNVRCVAIADGPSMLLRPDACIAWAGEGDDVDGLREALQRWFAAR